MDDEDREASPEPSSSHLCENSIDGYLSGDGPSASGVIDSSQLFSDTFDEEEDFVESQSKSPLNSSDYGLIPFERSYNYSEAVMACQVGQSNFCERSDVYSSPSHSKPNDHDFNSMDIDDNEPGSSSENFPSSECERQTFQGSSSSFEPNSNEDGSDLQYKIAYPLTFHKKSPEQNIVNLNASSSKQADSSLFGRSKEYGKNKLSKGKGKGKGKSSKQSFPFKFTGAKSSSKQRENKVDSSNKHSLFASHSPNPSNSLMSQIRRPTMAGTLNIDNEDNIEEEDPVNTSSHCEFLSQRDIQVLNEDEAYMVASSSEGVNGMHHILDIKSPTTPSDNCLVSSSTGQLDSLPPTPINFQGNDASHSSPASSPINTLNPPVLDSTVDSTSGQNLSYCDEEEEENENEDGVRSENDLEFDCSLDEDRNEISTSVSHVEHGIDSQELNLLVGTQGVFGEQQSNEGPHFVGPFLSLDNLHSSSLHSTLVDDKSNDESESSLVPTSSAYMSDSLEMPGSSHMSEASKRLLYRRRKVPSYSSLDANNSLGTSALPLNNINSISFSEESALNACHSEGALPPVGLIELDISEMEPESSNLVASSANIDGEEYPATSASALSPSESNFESSSTLAQLNQSYLLSSGDNSLSSEEGLSPESVSQTGPELNEGSLGLNGQLREKDDSLGSASDNEGTSNLHASLELGLGPQQLRCLSGSQQEPEPQSLVPPPHLLEEPNNTDSSTNLGLMECSLVGNVQSSNAVCSEDSLNKVSPCLKSGSSSAMNKNPFVIMVSEAEEAIPSHFTSLSAGPSSAGDQGKKKCLVGLVSPTKGFLDGNTALNLSTEPVCPLNMESSSPYVGSVGAKENINRIPNGVFRFRNSGSFEKFPHIEAQVSSSDDEEIESVSQILLPNEINPTKSVPINIHSLFGQRPSILKPSFTKPLNNHTVLHNSKDDDSLLTSSVKGVSFSDVCQSSDNFEPSPPSDLFSRSLSIESSKVELPKSEDSCLSQKLAGANEVKDVQLYNCDAESVMNAGPSCSEFSQSNHEIQSETTGTPFEGTIQPSVESVHEGNNGFWCADCEKFLETKCSLHRIQTIMDKPVLARAWASLPAQHLTIKAVSAESGGCKAITNGVFTRKAIPKRTQFGPLEGVFSKMPPPIFGLLFKTMQNNVEGFFDISEEKTSNWMRFVRAAATYTQMNCVVIEEESLIYFLTTANLPSKTELRVGYSKQYAVKYNLPLLVPTEEEKDLLQKTVACNSCNISFSSASELEEHLSSHKGGSRERRPKRKVCPKGFKQSSPQPQRLVKRVKVNRKTSGDKDEADFSSETKKSEKDSYDCMFCELSFRQQEILRLHSLGHPPFPSTVQEEEAGGNPECSSRPYAEVRICPSCSKRSKSLQEMIDHTKDHSFLSPKGSSEHRTFKCELCFKSFSNMERLASHSEIHKGDTKKPPYSCYYCFRRFCNKSALASHLKLHLECDGAKVYDCPICQEKFYGIASLKTHLPSHCINGEYTCPTCSKKFSSYHKIRRHIRSYHSAVHPCLQCGKNLPSLQKLKVHLVSHSDRRDFACLVCQKCFKRKDKMKEHLKRIHTVKREPNNNNSNNNHATFNNRKKTNPKFVPKVDPSDYKQFIYKCDLCLLGFKRRGMLVNHLSKRHPNIPLSSIPELNQPILRTSHSYICQYCGKSYVSSTKRKLHILKNHPGAEIPPSCASMGEEGSKTTRTYPASCPWCPRQYATKAKLLQHQRYHHGINKDQAAESEGKNAQEAPKAKEREELEVAKQPQEDLLTQALGRISGKAQFLRVGSEGEAPSVVELRVQHEGEELETSADRSKTSPASSAPAGDQVLVSPSFVLPHEGTSYALLTPDGADSFTLSLRPGQIIPAVGSFSVLSASDAPSTTESSNPGPSRLLPIDSVSHPQFTLDLNGMKGDSCVVAQVGAESPSPVLVSYHRVSCPP